MRWAMVHRVVRRLACTKVAPHCLGERGGVVSRRAYSSLTLCSCVSSDCDSPVFPLRVSVIVFSYSVRLVFELDELTSSRVHTLLVRKRLKLSGGK